MFQKENDHITLHILCSVVHTIPQKLRINLAVEGGDQYKFYVLLRGEETIETLKKKKFLQITKCQDMK